MNFALRNRESRVALWVGALVAIGTGFTFALAVILGEGGGSLSRGWSPGLSYLSFYGIVMIPVLPIVGLAAFGLSRLIGGGIVMAASILGLGALLIYSAVSSTPAAQLARVTGRAGIPDLMFEQFAMGHTFSDGTSYLWVVRCSPAEATKLSSALGLKSIPTTVKMDGRVPLVVEHDAVLDYRSIFEGGVEGIEFYVNDDGMIGGYSAGEQSFRLYWRPEIRRNNNG